MRLLLPALLAAACCALLSATATAQCNGEWITTSVSGPGTPAPRSGHASAYDPIRQRTIIFGGYTSAAAYDNATWEWDGATWTMPHPGGPVGCPTGRSSPSMAFLPSIGKVVLFGGLGPGGIVGETWTWDGATWTQLAIPEPAARYGASLFHLPFPSDRLILFAGQTTGGYTNETWQFDGAAWTQLNPFGTLPSPRIFHAMEWFPSFGFAILYGGQTNSGVVGDTHIFNGGSWSSLDVTCSPGPLANASISYDPGRGMLMINGGFDGTNFNFESWVLDHGPTTSTTWRKLVGIGIPGWAAARGAAPAVFDTARDRHIVFSGYAGFYQPNIIEFIAPDISISVAPQSALLATTDSVSFMAAANRPGPLAYQWRRNGVPLSDGPTVQGAMTDTLTIGPVTLAEDNGAYDCMITGPCGSLRSDPVTLGVDNPCPADFDANGNRDVPDIFAFLAAWFAGCP